jgi:hypothetical protein
VWEKLAPVQDLEIGATNLRVWGSTEPSRILLALETDADTRDSEDEIPSNDARVDVLRTQLLGREAGVTSAVNWSSGSDTRSSGRRVAAAHTARRLCSDS